LALIPSFPSFAEKLTHPQNGGVTRTWYRVLDAIQKLSGQLATPITIPANSFFQSGSLNSGGTLVPATVASGTLLGNSSGTEEAASPQTVDSTLDLSGGELGVAPQAAMTLLGNVGSVVAKPGPISIGQGLTVDASTTPPTLSAGSGGGAPPGVTDLTAAQLLSWWRGA